MVDPLPDALFIQLVDLIFVPATVISFQKFVQNVLKLTYLSSLESAAQAASPPSAILRKSDKSDELTSF